MARKPQGRNSTRSSNQSPPLTSSISTGTASTERNVSINPQGTNAYEVPNQFFPIPNQVDRRANSHANSKSLTVLEIIVSVCAILGTVGTCIWAFSKLDSKVDYIDKNVETLTSKTDSIQKDLANNIEKTKELEDGLSRLKPNRR